MKIGLLARADDGGLGQQTAEFYRHIHPHRTLVVDLGDQNRGAFRPDRYPDAMVVAYAVHDPIRRDVLRALCSEVDLVYTAEVPYSPELLDIAAEYGTRVVVHVNPELLEDAVLAAEVWLPTDWERARVEQRVGHPVPVVPFPAAIPQSRESRPPVTFVHVQAPAFLDRNGSELLNAALPLMTVPSVWRVFGDPVLAAQTHQFGMATVHFEGRVETYWDLYADAEILVLPRRYGGLSLPMQEAAACGLGVVSLDLDPQRGWLHPDGLIPTSGGYAYPMRGGDFWVHGAEPDAVARVLDRLAADPHLRGTLAADASAWAATITWDQLLPLYELAFEEPGRLVA